MIGQRSSILTIDSVNGKHAGNYTCHAKNQAGHSNYTTELKVYGLRIYFFFLSIFQFVNSLYIINNNNIKINF